METGEKEQTGNISLEEEGDLEEMMGSDAFQAQMYDDSPPMIPDETYALLRTAVNQDGTLKEILRAKKSDFVRNLIYLDGKKFDFSGRGYLRPIYDGNFKRVLLKTARQVEKCCHIDTEVLRADGRIVRIADIEPGQQIVAMGADGRQVLDTVLASGSNGRKPCVLIRTRLGSSLTVTLNHPLRTLMGWLEAGALLPGDKIASLRTQGFFGDIDEPQAELIGMMIGDGCATDNAIRFTCKSPALQERFRELYGECTFSVDSRTGTRNYYVSKKSDVIRYFLETGLFGKTAATKELPEAVFSLDEASASALLRGLWATDGHCKNLSSSKVDLVYCTVSRRLADQIRRLLRKFGIITTMRVNYPSNGGRDAYLLRVTTRKSLENFHRRIGPIPGKPFTLPDRPSNSNLDTLPKEIHGMVLEARKRKNSYWQRDGFQSKGLRINTANCPTFEKIAAFNEVLCDPALQAVLDADIIWDEIVSIEPLENQPTWGIETHTQTFVADCLVNHNTTFLANNLTCTSVVMPYNKALYVSPSHTQTRQFSNEKLRPAIERSPLIKRYFQDSFVSTQVFEKGFTNGSYIFLRSAFRTADRTRGISARVLCLDELQDFLTTEIPVIRECTSHYPDASDLMAGTPKSHDNPIEIYWQSTTQSEWLVPCRHCGKWNFLDESNIGPTDWYASRRLPPGPICKKCQKPINPPDGRWVEFYPDYQIKGFRIPQLMVPWICGIYDQWQKLLWKRDNYPFGQFSNEVLGLSYDSASKPITRDELMESCGEFGMWNLSTPEGIRAAQAEAKRWSLTAGVDWGEGNDGSEKSPSGKIRNASYTVVAIGAYVTQRHWRMFYAKKYEGREVDPDFVVRDITRICQLLGVKLIGADWGHGWGVNNVLMRTFGPNRVAQFQYMPKLKQRMKWEPIGYRYQLQRNFILSELFFDIKHGLVQFPKWKDFEPFAKDILAIYAEYVEYRREIKYDHRPSEPDDFFHSLNYAKLMSDIMTGKSRRYTIDAVQVEGPHG